MKTKELVENINDEVRESLERYSDEIVKAKWKGRVPEAAHARHEIRGYAQALLDLGYINPYQRKQLRMYYASTRPDMILKRGAI